MKYYILRCSIGAELERTKVSHQGLIAPNYRMPVAFEAYGYVGTYVLETCCMCMCSEIGTETGRVDFLKFWSR